METKHLENISTINGWFVIHAIGESLFWEVNKTNNPQKYRFLSLESARSFIRETEDTLNIDNLFQKYVDRNQGVTFE